MIPAPAALYSGRLISPQGRDTVIIASDLEGTLTTGATWVGVGEYLKVHGHAARYRLFFAAHLPGALLARPHLINQQRYKERWLVDLAQLLRGFTPAELDHMAEWVVEHEMWPGRRTDVLAELEGHMAAGRRVILASGTYQPVIEAFARRIGVTECLGTPFTLREGRATGHLAGPMNTGERKIAALRAYLNGAVLDMAYGDTAADIPMLAAAASAVAVYPDGPLRDRARREGWRILDGAAGSHSG
ncbi:MAG: hypothetical protein Kow00124_23440 [Anaerolineae bacterium]